MNGRSIMERAEFGREARRTLPRSAHAGWTPAEGRADPVDLLVAQNQTRVPWLVPVRHARMSVSPFTFYRGTARIMASDLATLPHSELTVQLVGDGHLSNFGAYASPERALVFDVNDFDETLTGPFEWDVKRLAASFLVAARHNGFKGSQGRRIVERTVASYRESIARYAEMRFLELWYEHTSIQDVGKFAQDNSEAFQRRLADFEAKARSKNSLQALSKLAENVDGRFRIRTDRPVLVPLRELFPDMGPDELDEAVREAFDGYLETLRDDRRSLLARYELRDVALKVVGVGSVGTRCAILLLEGRDENDPLFLQAKEANNSVLEEFLHPSRYSHHGERVIAGQRQIQAQSDIFLGWSQGRFGVNYYFRQLRDWKRSFEVESASPGQMESYGRLCGQVLARGHARSGDPVSISAYLGGSSKFDQAIVAFSEKYADQTETDYARFMDAIAGGVLETSEEI